MRDERRAGAGGRDVLYEVGSFPSTRTDPGRADKLRLRVFD